MNHEEIEVAVERRKKWLDRQLDHAFAAVGVMPAGTPVINTYDMRSAGTIVISNDDNSQWLRVAVEDIDYQPASRWNGNIEANAIHGIPKPEVLRWADWEAANEDGQNRRVRAELMTLAVSPPIMPDGMLTHDPQLPDQWWADLNTALRKLARHTPAPDDLTDTLSHVAIYARELIGREFNPETVEISWSTAHADLHWGNLTGPTLCILDWESWRTAPAGYDAATLYCNSLPHPPTADRVKRTFSDLLSTPTGHVAQLAAALRYLAMADDDGPYHRLSAPLRSLATQLVDTLNTER